MLDSIEGYLDNIAAAATQVVANGGPLAELLAILAISVDTVAAQAKEIKRIYKQINSLKKKGSPISSSVTTTGGSMTVNVCPYCAVVGRSAPHKKNSC